MNEWNERLKQEGATWDHGMVTAFQGSPPLTDAHQDALCDLSHLGILRISGPDAQKFLQGQLTCNLNYLTTTPAPGSQGQRGHSSLGACCNPKGRVISAFRILPTDDGYLLGMHRSLLPLTLDHLKKYMVFFKAGMEDITSNQVCLGVSGKNAHQPLKPLQLALPEAPDEFTQIEDTRIIRLPGSVQRFEVWLPTAKALQLINKLPASGKWQSTHHWLRQDIRSGIPLLQAPLSGEFIPQQLNLGALGGISFKKGCYTGQEIVARMQHLGKLKSRLYRIRFDSEEIPEVGSVFYSTRPGNSAGTLVLAVAELSGKADAAEKGGTVEGLAVLREDAVESGDLRVGNLQAPPVQVLDLPYALNPEKELQH
jgi:folate-binding protein YgfZ